LCTDNDWDPQFALDRQTTHAHCALPTRREKNHKSINGSAGEAFADRTETGFDQMGVYSTSVLTPPFESDRVFVNDGCGATSLRSVVTGVEQEHRVPLKLTGHRLIFADQGAQDAFLAMHRKDSQPCRTCVAQHGMER
jgi:hypothetical protein